jgi:SOS-response transcriptional repressor LexA
MDVETLGIRPTARTFGLQVRGLDDRQTITDGDIAIIEHGVQPRSGDVVAA